MRELISPTVELVVAQLLILEYHRDGFRRLFHLGLKEFLNALICRKIPVGLIPLNYDSISLERRYQRQLRNLAPRFFGNRLEQDFITLKQPHGRRRIEEIGAILDSCHEPVTRFHHDKAQIKFRSSVVDSQQFDIEVWSIDREQR